MESPIACKLDALTREERERHRVLIRKLGSAVKERREDTNGYSLGITQDQMSLAEIGEWIGLESRCCPFLDFQITLSREGGPLWVSLSGRPGVKAFLKSEFGL